MKLYRVTYSGEAYVLAGSADDAVRTMARRVNDDETGVIAERATEAKLSDVRDHGWLDALPFRARGVPDDSRSIREILEGE